MTSLLDTLKEYMGCWVLSDLHNVFDTEAFRLCVQEIPKGVYSLSEWEECVWYLNGYKKKLRTEKEARYYLTQKKQEQTGYNFASEHSL